MNIKDTQALKQALEGIAALEKRIEALEKQVASLEPKKPGRPKKDSNASDD